MQRLSGATSIVTSRDGVGGVRPVGGWHGGLVLFGAGLVKHRQQLVGFVSQGLEIDNSVRAVAVVRVEDQITVEISSQNTNVNNVVDVTQNSIGNFRFPR